MNWMAASFSQIKSVLNLMNINFICCCHSLFEFCHIFKWPISYSYNMILLYILVMRHEYVFHFVCICVYIIILTASNRVSVSFFMVFMLSPNKLTSAQTNWWCDPWSSCNETHNLELHKLSKCSLQTYIPYCSLTAWEQDIIGQYRTKYQSQTTLYAMKNCLIMLDTRMYQKSETGFNQYQMTTVLSTEFPS